MAIVTLREHQSTAIAAHGMLQIQAFPAPGYSQQVHLSLEGEGTINTVSTSELRLIRGTGTLSMVVRPLHGDEFGPGTSIRVYLTRGRQGTPQEHGAEIVDITLDGRSDTKIGTLTYDGDQLIVASAFGSSQGNHPFDGVAASVRAGLRALINRRRVDLSGLTTAPTTISLDTSVSMKSLVTQEDLDIAVDVFSGIVGALKPETTFFVSDDRADDAVPVSTRDELSAYAQRILSDEHNHIGSSARRAPGEVSNPTFSISDEAPYAAEPYGVNIVVGDSVRTSRINPVGTRGILLITEEFRGVIEGDNQAAKDAVYEHLLESCLGDQALGEVR